MYEYYNPARVEFKNSINDEVSFHLRFGEKRQNDEVIRQNAEFLPQNKNSASIVSCQPPHQNLQTHNGIQTRV